MKPALTIATAALAFTTSICGVYGQQAQNTPHAGYVYPAGGQRGATFQVQVGGQFLNGVTAVLASGSGIRAAVVDYSRPMNGKEMTELRDQIQELQKAGNSPSTQKEIARLREQLGETLRRSANPPISERVTIEIAIAADAEPGTRSLRLVTPLGLTNPLVFCVGELPEFREAEVKNSRADTETAITLPAVVNGRIIPGDADRVRFPLRQAPQYMPGDVDRFRFHARKGQQLVAVVSARDLMPYLADAVPGWFQATLTLYDAQDRELAYDDDYRFHPDPVLHYQVQADGDYVLEIKDALYRGREDFVYRIAVGELPFVTAAFPLGGRAGTSTAVDIAGWNLPSRKVTMAAVSEPGVYALPVRSNRTPFAVDTLPEVVEREPNNSMKQAQPVTLPVIVNGRIQAIGDQDVFSFRGRAGDEIAAEVYARRLESPLDSVLELIDASGRRVAFNDDHGDKVSGLLTHQADSALLARLPVDGTYFVRIGDVQHKGGSEYGYRLRISAPRPDFELRIAPSTINAGGGQTVPVSVVAVRKDGFAGDIDLKLTDVPPGFALSGAVIPAGQDQVRLTITVPTIPTREPVTLNLEGHATIAGQTVAHRAAPADDVMQAFAYWHLVPADALRAVATTRGAIRVQSRIVNPLPLKIPAGGSARVRVALPPGYLTFDNVRFDLDDAPVGITVRDVSLSPGGAEFGLQADSSKLTPGLRGNLIVTVSGERVPPSNQQGPAVRRRVALGTLPAISFEITSSH